MVIQVYQGAEAENVNSDIKVKNDIFIVQTLDGDVFILARFAV